MPSSAPPVIVVPPEEAPRTTHHDSSSSPNHSSSPNVINTGGSDSKNDTALSPIRSQREIELEQRLSQLEQTVSTLLSERTRGNGNPSSTSLKTKGDGDQEWELSDLANDKTFSVSSRKNKSGRKHRRHGSRSSTASNTSSSVSVASGASEQSIEFHESSAAITPSSPVESPSPNSQPTPPLGTPTRSSVEYRCFSNEQVEELRRRSNSISESEHFEQQRNSKSSNAGTNKPSRTGSTHSRDHSPPSPPYASSIPLLPSQAAPANELRQRRGKKKNSDGGSATTLLEIMSTPDRSSAKATVLEAVPKSLLAPTLTPNMLRLTTSTLNRRPPNPEISARTSDSFSLDNNAPKNSYKGGNNTINEDGHSVSFSLAAGNSSYNSNTKNPLHTKSMSVEAAAVAAKHMNQREKSAMKNTIGSVVGGGGVTTTAPTHQNRTPKIAAASPALKPVLDYVKSEMLSDNTNLGSPEKDCDNNMQEFLSIPGRVEKLLLFGLAVCCDSYLYVLTVLPLKSARGCVCGIWTLARFGRNKKFRFHRRHMYQLLQSLIICSVYYILLHISVGMLYHWIRGQNMLKHYLIIAIVEIFDRLMCSFGQDALDSLYWNTTRRPRHPRMIISFLVVFVYALLHSLILFVHVATLNVAMNSADQALLTLLIGGNFAEIKSTVFKKYNKQTLFKIVTSDICERFKLALFLFLILLLNFFQGGNKSDSQMVWDFLKQCSIVMAAEHLADWIKHSFITKFNFIPGSVYRDYALIISGDLTGVGHEGMNLDHTHAVVKRVGLAQIPLVCVMARYLREAMRYSFVTYENTKRSLIVMWIGCFLVLLVVKIMLGIVITGAASRMLSISDDEPDKKPHKTKRQHQLGRLSIGAPGI